MTTWTVAAKGLISMPSPVKDPDFVRDMYTVSSWEDVSAALKSPALVAQRKLQLPTRQNILVFIDGQEHLERRKIESPVFNREALAEYERSTLRPLLDEYIERWRETGRSELVNETLMLLVRIGALLTGIEGVETDEEAREVLGYVDAFASAGAVEFSKLDEDGQQEIIRRAEESAAQFELSHVDPARAKREGLIADVEAGRLERSELPRDVITALLSNWQQQWKPELLTLEVLAYLTGSARTSMRLVCNAVDEIRGWVTRHPEEEPLLEDSMFIRKAVNEALRLHVVTPILLRMTERDVELPSGLRIPAGEYVAILYAHANRDPRYFGEDADEFDPHRSERRLPGRDHGLSFAAGAHACIGRRLAVGAGGEADSANNGTVITLVEDLMRLGAEPDPDDPPEPDGASFYDQFVRYPVRFTRA